MKRRAAGLFLALLLAVPMSAAAQDVVQQSAIVTLDQNQLFLATKYGKALQSRFEAETAALMAENRKIDSQLEAEERALTDKRATMTAQDFHPLGDAFDKKANELRNAQDVKGHALGLRREEDQQAFVKAVRPILGDYMVERGAVAILDQSAIVVSLGSIDITAEVIARIDERLGDGSNPAPPPPAPIAPTPEPAPITPAPTTP